MISVFLACLFALLFVVSSALLVRATKNSMQIIDKLDELEEQLDTALQILEERHKRLEAKSKTEVFFDDPIVKETVREIADCRDAVSLIVNNFKNEEEQADQTQ